MGQEQLIQMMEKEYHPLLCKAIHLLHHRQDAEDALQSAYLKAWLRRDSLREEKYCLAWLNRIVYNECMNILRSQKRQPFLLYDEQLKTLPSLQNDATGCLEKMALDSMFSQLPRNWRKLMFYRYFVGCNIAETAWKMQLPEGTVKSQLFQTRRLLKKQLNQASIP